MTAYNAISDGEKDADSPITEELETKYRDNPLAIAEGDASAPRIRVRGFDISQDKLGGGSPTDGMVPMARSGAVAWEKPIAKGGCSRVTFNNTDAWKTVCAITSGETFVISFNGIGSVPSAFVLSGTAIINSAGVGEYCDSNGLVDTGTLSTGIRVSGGNIEILSDLFDTSTSPYTGVVIVTYVRVG